MTVRANAPSILLSTNTTVSLPLPAPAPVPAPVPPLSAAVPPPKPPPAPAPCALAPAIDLEANRVAASACVESEAPATHTQSDTSHHTTLHHITSHHIRNHGFAAAANNALICTLQTQSASVKCVVSDVLTPPRVRVADAAPPVASAKSIGCRTGMKAALGSIGADRSKSSAHHTTQHITSHHMR
jgi:hypothetical protein